MNCLGCRIANQMGNVTKRDYECVCQDDSIAKENI
ncbi:hypothetical protein PAAL109150_00040 [Paenibacillus alkaliterrae]